MNKAQAVNYFHESNKWDNPCTPETFKRFNQKFTGNF